MRDFLFKNPLSNFRLPLMAILGLILMLQPASVNPAQAASSQIMPLAEKSLLLDGQVIGDRIIVVGERGHILTSEDDGKTWQQQEVPTRATLTSVFFIDPANGWAAGHDGVILQTSDGGRHWQEIYSDPEDERPILDLWFPNKKSGFAIGAYGLFLETHNGGRSWEPADFTPATLLVDDDNGDDPWGGEDDEVWVDFHLNQMATTTSGRMFVSAEAGNLYRSDDGCRSWLSLPSPYEGSFYGSLALNHRSLILFGLRGNLFRTEDAGETWTSVETGTQSTLNDAIQLADGRIALAGLDGALLISDDNGRSFTLHSDRDRTGIARVLQAKDGSLILIGDNGVKRVTLPPKSMEAGS